MSEATRGWIYRVALLALIGYLAIARPDLEDVILALVGVLSSGLATGYTSIRRVVRGAQESGSSSQRRR